MMLKINDKDYIKRIFLIIQDHNILINNFHYKNNNHRINIRIPNELNLEWEKEKIIARNDINTEIMVDNIKNIETILFFKDDNDDCIIIIWGNNITIRFTVSEENNLYFIQDIEKIIEKYRKEKRLIEEWSEIYEKRFS